MRVLARTQQGWPNVSESQLQWTSIVMPSVEPNEFKIEDIIDLQVSILNTTVMKVCICIINFYHKHIIKLHNNVFIFFFIFVDKMEIKK